MALLEAEFMRHLEGKKAGTPWNAAHRMALGRTLALLRKAGHIPQNATFGGVPRSRGDLLTIFNLLSIFDPKKKSPLWDALREDDAETE